MTALILIDDAVLDIEYTYIFLLQSEDNLRTNARIELSIKSERFDTYLFPHKLLSN